VEEKHRRYTIQERHRFTWFTQCGLRPPEKFPGPFFITIQQNEGIQPTTKPIVTSSSFSHSLLSQNTILEHTQSCIRNQYTIAIISVLNHNSVSHSINQHKPNHNNHTKNSLSIHHTTSKSIHQDNNLTIPEFLWQI
jgi:hypothetical protein